MSSDFRENFLVLGTVNALTAQSSDAKSRSLIMSPMLCPLLSSTQDNQDVIVLTNDKCSDDVWMYSTDISEEWILKRYGWEVNKQLENSIKDSRTDILIFFLHNIKFWAECGGSSVARVECCKPTAASRPLQPNYADFNVRGCGFFWVFISAAKILTWRRGSGEMSQWLTRI